MMYYFAKDFKERGKPVGNESPRGRASPIFIRIRIRIVEELGAIDVG